MLEISFTISTEDANRLFEVMEMEGADSTANEYARSLFTGAIRAKFPAVPRYDEAGNLLNPDAYCLDCSAK